MSATQSQIDKASKDTFKSLELVHLSHPKWPLNPSNPTTPIHVSILDSSFNPPTKAHHAIASSSFPPSQASSSSSSSPSTSATTSERHEYTARLLLFSARNVDKKLKAGDASISQRFEMMNLQSSSMNDSGGTAVGLINEPTFVGKSRIIQTFLRDYLASLTPTPPKVTLTFLIGTDTLIRFFDPRYYPSEGMRSSLEGYFNEQPEGDGSFLVSAKRGKEESDRGIEDEILRRDEVKGWAEKGKIRLLGDGNEGWEDISSTRVREMVKSWGDDQSDEERVKQLEALCLPSIAAYIVKEGLYRD